VAQIPVQRADAVRNRSNILAAGRSQIAEHGPTVSMEQIATEAGVAVGTLYRHFPTKADLVSAVVDEFVDAVADDAEACAAKVAAGASAAAELGHFLRRVVDTAAANNAAKAAVQTVGESASSTRQDSEQRAVDAIAALLQHGQSGGDLHPDITVADIYLLFASAPTDRPRTDRHRWVSLVLQGLSPPQPPGAPAQR